MFVLFGVVLFVVVASDSVVAVLFGVAFADVFWLFDRWWFGCLYFDLCCLGCLACFGLGLLTLLLL